MQTIIEVTNEMIMIEPKSRDRPCTLALIPNKALRQQLTSAAQVTLVACNVIPQHDKQPKINEISYDNSLFDDKLSIMN